jgi:hypothetical protein
VRLNPIETQWPALLVPRAAENQPTADWRELRAVLSEQALGLAAPEFFDAWERLGPSFTLAEGGRAAETHIHYYGPCDSIPHILGSLDADRAVVELERLRALLPRQEEGRRILDDIARRAPQETLCLRFWRLAAKAIHARAEESILFLEAQRNAPDRTAAGRMLLRCEALKDEYRAALLETCAPASVARELSMLFDGPLRQLMRMANGDAGG